MFAARQEEATVKRIKLEYDDIGALGRQNLEVWEMVINKEARKADDKMLFQAIKQGMGRPMCVVCAWNNYQ